MMNKPIFILGAHKSGSTLLRSLLDGHHELFVVPLETHIFQNACFWVDYRLRRTHPQALGFEAIKQNFINQVEEYNTSTDYMSDANLVGRFDMRRFRKQLLATSAKTFDEIISQYLAAIYENLFHKSMPEHLRIVEKSVENAEFAIDLNHMYADAKFIHILRNPYANVVSLRRHIGRKGYPFLAQIILALKNSFYNLYRNRRLIDNYLIIKYEDLIIYL